MQVSFNYKTQWHGLSDENILFDDYLVLLRSREIYGDACDGTEDQGEDAVKSQSPSLTGLMQGESFSVARDKAMRALRQSLQAPRAGLDSLNQLMAVQQALCALTQQRPMTRTCLLAHKLIEIDPSYPLYMQIQHGMQCNLCKKKIVQKGKVSWRCDQCDYDICQQCSQLPVDPVSPSAVKKASKLSVLSRLGILTLFPLYQSLRTSQKAENYSALHSETLDIIIEVLTNAGAQSLENEPSDCIAAFMRFITNQIEEQNFVVDTDDRAKAVIALVAVAVASGKATELLRALECLFKIAAANASDAGSPALKLGVFLGQLLARANKAILMPHDDLLYDAWNLDNCVVTEDLAKRGENYPTLCSNGRFFFVHNSAQGLLKIGTGQQRTIKGLQYAHQPKYHAKESGASSLSLASLSLPPMTNGSYLNYIKETLYFVYAEQPAVQATTTATTATTTPVASSAAALQAVQDRVNLDLLLGGGVASTGFGASPALNPLLAPSLALPTTIASSTATPSATPSVAPAKTSLTLALIDPVTLLEQRKIALASLHLEKEGYHVFSDGTSLYLVIKPAAPAPDASQKGFGAKSASQSFGGSFGNPSSGLGAPSFFGGGSSTSNYIRMVLQGVTPDDEDQLHDVCERLLNDGYTEEEITKEIKALGWLVDDEDGETADGTGNAEDENENDGNEEFESGESAVSDDEYSGAEVAELSEEERASAEKPTVTPSGEKSQQTPRAVEKSSSSTCAKLVKGAHFIVEVYDVSQITEATTELAPVRAFELADNATITGPSVLEPPQYAKAVFYADSKHVACLIPANFVGDVPFNFERVRLYSLTDGQLISETFLPVVIGGGNCVTYCEQANMIYSYNYPANKITAWHNSSAKANETHTADFFINKIQTPRKDIDAADRVYSLRETITYLIGAVDKIAQTNPLDKFVTLEWKAKDADRNTNSFPVGEDVNIFPLVQSLMTLATQRVDDVTTHSYYLSVLLNVLKINLISPQFGSDAIDGLFKKAGHKDGGKALFDTIAQRLLGLIQVPVSTATGQPALVVSDRLRTDAIAAFVAGFRYFYRTTKEQLNFFFGLLKNPREEDAGTRRLLETLFDRLADWSRLSEILVDSTTAATTEPPTTALPRALSSVSSSSGLTAKTASSKSKRALRSDAKSTTKSSTTLTASSESTPVASTALSAAASSVPSVPDALAFEFLEALVASALTEAKAKIASDATGSVLSLSPTLRLLLALQKDLCSGLFGGEFLLRYSILVIAACEKFLETVWADKDALLAVKGTRSRYDLLEDSIVGPVLKSLFVALSRKENGHDVAFKTALLRALIPLASLFDKINAHLSGELQKQQKNADGESSAVLFDPPANHSLRRKVVETPHPLLPRTAFKKTITIPGASSISLRFDPRSQTSSNAEIVIITMGDKLVGKFAASKFPKTSLTLEGNSVSFEFKMGGAPDPTHPSFWGFRCFVEPYVAKADFVASLPHWSLGIEANCVWLASQHIKALLDSEKAEHAKERRFKRYLQHSVFGGGVEGDSSYSQADQSERESSALAASIAASDEDNAWLKKFVDFAENSSGSATLSEADAKSRDEMDRFWQWIVKKFQVRRGGANRHIPRIERLAFAVMIKHVGLVGHVRSGQAHVLANEEPSESWLARLRPIYRKYVEKMALQVRERCQIEMGWQDAVIERNSVEYFEQFTSAETNLAKLCELRRVANDRTNPEKTIAALRKKLQRDIDQFHAAKDKEKNANTTATSTSESTTTASAEVDFTARVNDHVCLAVIQKLQFLLTLAPQHAETRYLGENREYFQRLLVQAQQQQPVLNPTSPRASPKTWLAGDLTDAEKSMGRSLTQSQSSRSAQSSTARAVSQEQRLVDGLIQFAVDIGLAVRDVEACFALHNKRAQNKILGLGYLHQLLAMHSKFERILQISLGVIDNRSGEYYLDGVRGCSHVLTQQLNRQLATVLQDAVQLLSSEDVSDSVRQLAIGASAFTFQARDATLIHCTSIFPLLQRIFSRDRSEKEPVSHVPDEKAVVSLGLTASDDVKDAKEKAASLEASTAQIEREKSADRLESAAWTAFRLLALQCTWEPGHDDTCSVSPDDEPAIRALQQQIFVLVCYHLERLSSRFAKYTLGDARAPEGLYGERCFQLLSLIQLCVAGDSLLALNFFSDSRCLQCFFAMLGTNLGPRSQQLILRLLRKLLIPVKVSGEITEFYDKIHDELSKVQFCLTASEAHDEAAKSLNSAASEEKDAKEGIESPTTEPATSPTTPISASGSAKDKKAENESANYCVLLRHWIQTEQLLQDTCREFLPREDAEKLDGKKLLAAMASEGFCSLRGGSKDQCRNLAKALVNLGATTTVVAEDEVVDEGNPNQAHQAFYWLNSQAAAFLSSEYIALIRSMSHTSPFWARVMKDKVETGLIADLKTFLALEKANDNATFNNYSLFGRVFAKLNVIGGFEETVRVGGRVLLSRDRDEKRVGTVTCALFGSSHVDILLETGERMSQVDANSLLACPEVEVSPSLMSSLSTELFLLLLSVIDVDINNNGETRSANFARLVSQLQSKALAVVLKLISSKNVEALLNNSASLPTIHRLVALAKECKPQYESERVARANEKHARLHWDVASNPLSQLAHRTGGRSMQELLPYFPAHVRESSGSNATNQASSTTAGAAKKTSELLLPTRFLDVKDSQGQGQIFWGNDYRDVECIVIPAYSRDIKYESLVFGNVAIPLQADYYFEITVLGVTSDSVISIGLSPESDVMQWEFGSFRYRSDKKKCRYKRDKRYGLVELVSETFGSAYNKVGAVVGCGWHPETRAIYFTSNGSLVSGKPAFTEDLAGKRLLPAVGLRNARVRVNFGQEKLLYHGSGVPGETTASAKKERPAKPSASTTVQPASTVASSPLSPSLANTLTLQPLNPIAENNAIRASLDSSADRSIGSSGGVGLEPLANPLFRADVDLDVVPVDPALVEPEEKPAKTDDSFEESTGTGSSEEDPEPVQNEWGQEPVGGEFQFEAFGGGRGGRGGGADHLFGLPPQRGGRPPRGPVQVNPEQIAFLSGMGFTARQAEVALRTNDNDVNRALDWLFEGNGEDIVDDGEAQAENDDGEEANVPDIDEAPLDLNAVDEDLLRGEDEAALAAAIQLSQAGNDVDALLAGLDAPLPTNQPQQAAVDGNAEIANSNSNDSAGANVDEKLPVVEQQPPVVASTDASEGEKKVVVPDATDATQPTTTSTDATSDQTAVKDAATGVVASDGSEKSESQQQIDAHVQDFASLFSTMFNVVANDKKESAEIAASNASESTGEKKSEEASDAAANKSAEEIKKVEEDSKPKVNADTQLPVAEHKRYHDLAMKSGDYVLTNGCRFTSEGKQLNVDNKKNALERWERVVFPQMMAAMKKARMVDFEIDEYMYLLTQKIKANDIKGAAAIFRKATNRDLDKNFLSGKSKSTEVNLKIDQVKIGDILVVNKKYKYAQKKSAEYLNTPCIVKAINFQMNLVFLNFYSPQTGTVDGLWFPITHIAPYTQKKEESATNKKSAANASETTQSESTATPVNSAFDETSDSSSVVGPGGYDTCLAQGFAEASKNCARKIILALLNYAPITTDSASPLDFRTIIHLTANEYLSDSGASRSKSRALGASNLHDEREVRFIEQRLRELYASLDSREQEKQAFTANLIEDSLESLQHVETMMLHKANVAGDKSSTVASLVEIKDALSITVCFDAACNFSAPDTFSMEFFADQDCKFPLKIISNPQELTQFTLPQNRFYHKLTVTETEGAESNKNTFLFYALPNSIHFAVAYWRIQYLIANCFHVENSQVFVSLLSSMVDHLFHHDVPTQNKELTLSLLSQLMWAANHHPNRSQFHDARFFFLEEELKMLFTLENKAPMRGFFSSYLQSLADFMVTAKIFSDDSKLESDLLKFRDLKTATLLLEYFVRPNAKKQASGNNSEVKSTSSTTTHVPITAAADPESALTNAAEKGSDQPTTLASSTASLREKKVARAVESLPASSASEKKLKGIVEKCWKEVQKETIQDCVVIVQGVVTVPVESLETFKDALLEKMNECAPVKRESLYVAVDKAKRRTVPWIAVECVTAKGPAQLAKKLPPLLVLLKSELEQTHETVIEEGEEKTDATSETTASSTTGDVVESQGEKEPVKSEDSKTGETKETKPESASATSELTDQQQPAAKDGEPEKEKEVVRSASKKTGGVTDAIKVNALKELTESDAALLEYCRAILFDLAAESAEQHELSSVARATLQTIYTDLAAQSQEGKVAKSVIERRFGLDIELEVETPDENAKKTDAASTNVATTTTNAATESSEQKSESESEKEPVKESQPAAAKEEVWLDLNEFLMLVRETAHRLPLSTLNRLFTEFGFDFHLHRNHYLSLDACWQALEDPAISFREIDRQLVQYLELSLSSTPDMAKLADLRPSHVLPIDKEHAHAVSFSRLIGKDTRLLRLRAEMLKTFNASMVLSLPLVDFNGRGVISSLLSENRHLLLSAGKLDYFYDILERTSVEGNQPTVNLNRVKIAAGKSKLEARLQTGEGALKNSSDNQGGHVSAANNSGASSASRSASVQSPGGVDLEVESLLKDADDWIAKNTIFGAAYAQLAPGKTDAQLYRQRRPTGHNPHYSINILFQGENVEGIGGPYRQFFTDVAKELQTSHRFLPLFTPCPNARNNTGHGQDQFVIKSASKSQLHLNFFRFLGQLMGMAIRTGVTMPFNLPSLFWKQLVGIPLTQADIMKNTHYHDIKFATLVKLVQKWDVDTILLDHDALPCFAVTLSDGSHVALKPGGENELLTEETRNTWVELALEARLNEANLQIKYIQQGISEVIPMPLLSLFTPQDFEWRVCGKPMIDMNLLRRHTQYSGGYSATTPVITYFWKLLDSFSFEERVLFIRFVWAQERIPADDQEFLRTSTRFLINPYVGATNPDRIYPKANTCFFNLILPEYTSFNVLKEKFTTCIHLDTDSMNADNVHNQPTFI